MLLFRFIELIVRIVNLSLDASPVQHVLNVNHQLAHIPPRHAKQFADRAVAAAVQIRIRRRIGSPARIADVGGLVAQQPQQLAEQQHQLHVIAKQFAGAGDAVRQRKVRIEREL